MIEIIFYILICLIIYPYLAYPFIIFVLARLKKTNLEKNNKSVEKYEPEVTLFVAAYNEIDFLDNKILNSQRLDYNKNKIDQIWITDGSDDGTPEALRKYPEIKCYHENKRAGKIAAMNRGMKFVQSPIVIFSDANTELNKNAVKEIVSIFSDPQVGCVAGEKRIIIDKNSDAASTGEGLYWKYEAIIKKSESKINSVIGAAGELFAIRTKLFSPVEPDTILDDFIISMRIAEQGYKVKYTDKAYASETGSANVKEELKRKIRISAGGLQTIFRLKNLLNPFKHGFLSYCYISHKIFRWTISPSAFFLLFPINFWLAYTNNLFSLNLFSILFLCQILFYTFTFLGYVSEKKKLKFKLFFIPYYFTMINFAGIAGIFRFLNKKQSVNWEKAKRKQITMNKL